MKNFVPHPYRQVAVRAVDFPLTDTALRENLLGREAYRRTVFIVLKRGDACAIARVEKDDPEALFSPITRVELFVPPEACHWVDDASVDVGNPSQLAAKAKALGVPRAGTLVVHGRYEHVNFIHQPDPVIIRVLDVVPPEPGKLWTMAWQVLEIAQDLPALELHLDGTNLLELARAHPADAYLFPCQASGIEVGAPVYFLDTRPARRDWTMIGCERCAQFHRHFYGREPVQVDFCPKKQVEREAVRADGSEAELVLTKCCLLETTVECTDGRAIVPWGADLEHVHTALRYLASVAGEKNKQSFEVPETSKL